MTVARVNAGGRLILGLSGTNGAGKGTVACLLEERGFEVHSLSDVIRDALRGRGEVESRERMVAEGRALRAVHGPGALALRILERVDESRDVAVDSIRHPAEVEALRSARPAFRLVWIDAPETLRFERIRARGRSGDPTSLEEFQRLEAVELESESESGQKLLGVRDLRDFEIDNRGGLDTLRDRVEAILAACGPHSNAEG